MSWQNANGKVNIVRCTATKQLIFSLHTQWQFVISVFLNCSLRVLGQSIQNVIFSVWRFFSALLKALRTKEGNYLCTFIHLVLRNPNTPAPNKEKQRETQKEKPCQRPRSSKSFLPDFTFRLQSKDGRYSLFSEWPKHTFTPQKKEKQHKSAHLRSTCCAPSRTLQRITNCQVPFQCNSCNNERTAYPRDLPKPISGWN